MSHAVQIYIQPIIGSRRRVLTKAHENDAGWDMEAAERVEVPSKSTVNVPTHFAIAMPEGWCGIIKPRSSTLRRHGLIVMEGVIDAGYRGELFYQVYNPADDTIAIEEGWRLAQILFLPVPTVVWRVVDTLPDSRRYKDGFGSTGY